MIARQRDALGDTRAAPRSRGRRERSRSRLSTRASSRLVERIVARIGIADLPAGHAVLAALGPPAVEDRQVRHAVHRRLHAATCRDASSGRRGLLSQTSAPRVSSAPSAHVVVLEEHDAARVLLRRLDEPARRAPCPPRSRGCALPAYTMLHAADRTAARALARRARIRSARLYAAARRAKPIEQRVDRRAATPVRARDLGDQLALHRLVRAPTARRPACACDLSATSAARMRASCQVGVCTPFVMLMIGAASVDVASTSRARSRRAARRRRSRCARAAAPATVIENGSPPICVELAVGEAEVGVHAAHQRRGRGPRCRRAPACAS